MLNIVVKYTINSHPYIVRISLVHLYFIRSTASWNINALEKFKIYGCSYYGIFNSKSCTILIIFFVNCLQLNIIGISANTKLCHIQSCSPFHTHTHTHTCTRTHTHTRTHNTHMRTRTRARAHTHTRARAHMHTQHIHTHARTRTHILHCIFHCTHKKLFCPRMHFILCIQKKVKNMHIACCRDSTSI